MPNLGDLLESLSGDGGEEHLGELLKLLSMLGGDSGGDFGKRMEMVRLYSEGIGHYQRDENDAALSCWRKAFQVAVELGDEEMQVKLKQDEGDVLYRQNRLTEALTCYMELETMEGNPTEHWLGLTQQINIAEEIPIPLAKIEGLIYRTRTEMEQRGLQASYSKLLVMESQLASYRHDFSVAVEKAQEALSVYDADAYPNYDITTHYAQMIDAYLDAGDAESAGRWVERFEGVQTKFEIPKEQMILVRRMRLALLAEDYAEAFAYAMKTRAREAIVEAGIAAGLSALVRTPMVQMLIHERHNENAHQRYKLFCQAGDCHRGIAQGADADSRTKQRHTNMARRYYGWAMKVGQFIDERLECDWHEKEIRERIRSLK